MQLSPNKVSGLVTHMTAHLTLTNPQPNWPRGQNFGLGIGLKDLASASKLYPQPRPQTFGLGLASIALSYYVIRHFSGKNGVKFRNFVNFSGNNLKS